MGLFNFKKEKLDLVAYEVTKPGYEKVNRVRTNKLASRFNKVAAFSYENSNSKSNKARIMCMGDLMCEEKMYKAAEYGEDFFFHTNFKYVKEVLKECDLSIANLETMVDDSAPYTGEQYKINGKYHCNAPKAYLDALKYAGFDMFVMSNNHNLDCGIDGIKTTLENVDEYGFMRTGLFMPEEKRHTIVNVNGIKLAILSYSTWFNRNQDKLTDEGRNIFINEYSPEKVRKDVEAARKDGAEFVLVYMHWGIDVEYKNVHGPSQERMAKEIADTGADYIVGSHTHSLQDFDYVTNSKGRQIPVAYSVGNFATSDWQDVTRDNVILVLDLQKVGNNVTVETRYLPCHVYNEFRGLKYPIVPTVSKYNLGEGDAYESLKKYHNNIIDVIGTKVSGYGFSTGLNTDNVYSWIDTKEEKIPNMVISGVRFAQDTIPGCLAIASPISSNPLLVPSRDSSEKMADEAIRKGAVALVATHQIKNYPCIIVEHPVTAYAEICGNIREKFNPKTVGITGSIGKTSTTEMIYTLISSKFKTHRNTGSANSVRYSGNVVQGLKAEHEAYVQEIMEGPPYGAASTISKIVKPNIGVVTVVGKSHLEHFGGSQEKIWESCLGIQDGMEGPGTLVLNGDDPFQLNAKTDKKVLYYGIDNVNVDFRAENIVNTVSGCDFVIKYSGKSVPVRLKCFGKHNILNALAAFAVGKEYGMTDTEIVNGLLKYETSGIRQHLVNYDGYHLYLDCYNAAYESIVTAVKAIEDIYLPDARKVAVIGDVLELGDNTKEEHIKIGSYIAESNINIAIFYGDNCKSSYEEFIKSGKSAYWTNDKYELCRIIKEVINKGDLILFKGSHGMQLEHVVDIIFGTWYHEEFERYDFVAERKKNTLYNYTKYSDHITLDKYLGKETILNVPSEIDGLPVWGIASSCFSRNTSIEEVILPENVRNVRYCSFYMCENLKKVTLPNTLKVIDRSAFSTCKKLESVDAKEGITDIGYRAFGNCVALKNIALPKTVQHIGNEAFLNCSKLTATVHSNTVAEAYCKRHKIKNSI